MNWQKNTIVVAIGIVLWMLIVRWSEFSNQQYTDTVVVDQQPETLYKQAADRSISQTTTTTLPTLVDEPAEAEPAYLFDNQMVTVTTDV